ncbi:hypothetical protein [Ferrimonas balearica]|uniref:hypothetical protein n=1 Tax=Ferrimonas balearica TaxID=44012 RepID=UPI001C564621|nr:hypothetical protein [Ferrimonas balearica]MBW3162943.1 hypothetical protein [Ferrimonas balearica]
MKRITALLIVALAMMVYWHGSQIGNVLAAAKRIKNIEEPDSSLAKRYLLFGDWPVGLEPVAGDEPTAFFIQGEQPETAEQPNGDTAAAVTPERGGADVGG